MTRTRSPLARRIARTSFLTFASISALILLAQLLTLNTSATRSITVDPPNSTAAPQIVEAVTEFQQEQIVMMMIVSSTALLVISLVGTALSYRAATGSLRRVVDITTHTQEITANTLDDRLNLTGPRDEIKDLADTIDNTLEQLHDAFNRQQRFAANASHELRTPLTVIHSSLESLATQGLTEDDNLNRSLRSVRKMGTIIDSLLILANTQQLSPEQRFPTDLTAILKIVVHEAEADFQAKHIVASISAEEDIIVNGDQGLLVQATHNLIQNAARYTPPHGTAHVEVSATNKEVILTITNSGDDSLPDDVSQLLEPFHRGVNSRLSASPGHGLGLSLVDSIARKHGGALILAKNHDGGLAATVKLPRATQRVQGGNPRSPYL